MNKTIELLKALRKKKEISISGSFRRKQLSYIPQQSQQAVVIIGERGVGKTTMLLQYLRDKPDAFYFSADNPLVQDMYALLIELVMYHNITTIAIDEIHQGNDWQKSLKAAIDSFPEVQIIVSGSSSLDLYKGTSALARRTKQIYLLPLSFQEYMQHMHNIELPSLSFDSLLDSYETLELTLPMSEIQQYFPIYMQKGFYPYHQDDTIDYYEVLRRNLEKTLISDIPTFLNITTDTLSKLKKLMIYIAHIPPSEISYTNLSKKVGISIERLETVLLFLHKIGVVHLVIRSNKLSDVIRKEFKVMLANPNMYHAYGTANDSGPLRESFVIQALRRISSPTSLQEYLTLPRYGDVSYLHDDKRFTFEIGGAKKTKKQIQHISQGFVVADTYRARPGVIPLWMFGLLHGS